MKKVLFCLEIWLAICVYELIFLHIQHPTSLVFFTKDALVVGLILVPLPGVVEIVTSNCSCFDVSSV